MTAQDLSGFTEAEQKKFAELIALKSPSLPSFGLYLLNTIRRMELFPPRFEQAFIVPENGEPVQSSEQYEQQLRLRAAGFIYWLCTQHPETFLALLTLADFHAPAPANKWPERTDWPHDLPNAETMLKELIDQYSAQTDKKTGGSAQPVKFEQKISRNNFLAKILGVAAAASLTVSLGTTAEAVMAEKGEDRNFWLNVAIPSGGAGVIASISAIAAKTSNLLLHIEKATGLSHHSVALPCDDEPHLKNLIETTALLLKARDQQRPVARRQLLLERLEPRQGGLDR